MIKISNKFNILYNCCVIIYYIDNNLLLFINDYKVQLIKELKEFYKSESPLFILDLNNKELKNFCIKLINKIIGSD